MSIIAILAFLKANWKGLIIALIIAVILAAAYGAGWHMKGQADAADYADTIKKANDARDAAQARADKLAADFEQYKTDTATKTKTLKKKMEAEIAKKAIYHNCIVPNDGLHIYNEAIGSGKSGH